MTSYSTLIETMHLYLVPFSALFAWSYVNRFDTIPECDRHTHTQTDRQTETRRRHILSLA